MKEPTDGSGFARNCFQIKVSSTCLKCWLRHIDLAECSFVCTPFKEKGKGKTVAVAVAASSKQVVAVTIEWGVSSAAVPELKTCRDGRQRAFFTFS